MSAALMSAAMYLPIPKPEKLTLVAMADHASDDGTGVYLSNRRLQIKTSAAERTVRETIRKLEDANLVARVANLDGGRGLAVDYELNADFIYTVARANGWTQRRKAKPGGPPPAFGNHKGGGIEPKGGGIAHNPGGPPPPKHITNETDDDSVTIASQYPQALGESMADYLARLNELHNREEGAA